MSNIGRGAPTTAVSGPGTDAAGEEGLPEREDSKGKIVFRKQVRVGRWPFFEVAVLPLGMVPLPPEWTIQIQTVNSNTLSSLRVYMLLR